MTDARHTAWIVEQIESVAHIQGVTLSELSRRIGADRSYLSAARSRGSRLPVEVILRLALVLDVEPGFLLPGLGHLRACEHLRLDPDSDKL